MSATLPTSTGQDAEPAPEGAAACSSASRSWLLMMAVLLVAHLPLLYRYFTAMWQAEEHYRFFPFALLAAVGFAWQRRKRECPRIDWLWYVALTADLLLLAAGLLGSTPGAAVLGAALLVAWFLHRSRDRFTGGTLTTIALLVLIVVHLPMDKDLELRTDLQFATARISSGLLNLAGITHLRLGTVIEFPGKKFFIEEACSGIRSLLTLVFVSVFYGVWLRRGLLHTVFLAASAVLWSAFANVVRMLTICVAYAYYGADLATGWPHELLGFVMLFLAMGLMLSTDQLVGFVLQPIPLFPMEACKHEIPLNPFTEAWDRVVEFGSPLLGQIAELAPAVGDDRGTETAPSRRQVVFVMVPCLLMLVWQVPALWRSLVPQAVPPHRALVPLVLDTAKLPERLGSRTLASHHSEKGGVLSAIWTYGQTDQPVIVTFDGPYFGWHDLRICYSNTGWLLVEQRIRLASPGNGSNQADWPYVEAVMRSTTGEYGHLFFSMFDVIGREIYPPESFWTSLTRRFDHRWQDRASSETYGARVFRQSVSPLSPSERKQLLADHLLTREALRSEVIRQQGTGT